MARGGIQQAQHWPMISVEEQADRAQSYGLETLWYCPDAWAMRHDWTNQQTGEVQRARCNRWECRYCGPRKVDLWRQLVKQAEPVLFLTLTKAGKTVEQARRTLTTFLQALRRGSKGRGPNHLGARQAYPVEYFAVMERHQDFEQNGFHWHLLLKGVESIPYKEVIQPLWMSATHYDEQEGTGAKIGHVERIRNSRAIGYVTKYLTKSLSVGEKGTRLVERTRLGVEVDEQGDTVVEQQKERIEVVSKARRLSYSRHFFPDRVSELRARLFAGLEHETMEQEAGCVADGCVRVEEDDEWAEQESSEQATSTWTLRERGEFTRDKREHQRRKRQRLMEALGENRPLSRRVMSIWVYQRSQLAELKRR